jgi:hypothetical protein
MKIRNTSRLLTRKVQINSLESMDKTEEWLTSTLKEMGYKDIKNIFLAEYDKGQLHIVEY